jgi:chemotaxis protein CheX
MKEEYINPFITASTKIISEITGITPKLGKVYLKNTPYKSENILVLIGLTGKISGNVVITLSVETACKITSAMMMGMPVTEIDEMAKSAIGELCNMILGNTATIFSTNGVEIDITPPTILIGDNMQLSIHKSVIICIPILFEDGSMIEMDISYIDK